MWASLKPKSQQNWTTQNLGLKRMSCLMSGANVTIRGLDVSTFVTVRVAGRLQGCRVAGTDSIIFLCEGIEKILVVWLKKYIRHFFLQIFLVCIHTWTTCIIRRSSHQRVSQLAGPRFEPYLVAARRYQWATPHPCKGMYKGWLLVLLS